MKTTKNNAHQKEGGSKIKGGVNKNPGSCRGIERPDA